MFQQLHPLRSMGFARVPLPQLVAVDFVLYLRAPGLHGRIAPTEYCK